MKMDKGLSRTRNDWNKQKKETSNDDNSRGDHVHKIHRLGGVLKKRYRDEKEINNYIDGYLIVD